MRLLPAAAAAVLLAWLTLPPVLSLSDCGELGVGVHADPGEALLHRIKPSFSQEASAHMPLTSLWATQTCRHSAPAAFKLRLALSLAAPALLILILGRFLAPLWAAVLALALTLKAGWQISFTLQWIYAAFVLLAAAVLVWRARKPSLARSACLGAAVGTSLLFRSPLVFFPPLLVFYEWIVLYRFSLKKYWKEAAALLLIPYLFLLPWTLMNWIEFKRFVPLENGEADCLVMTGAAGLVRSTLGDCRGLLQESGEDREASALRWAAAEVLREPSRYLKACLARLTLVLSLQPHLFLGAVLGFWLLRRRAEVRALALLGAYFLGVHCLLAIQPHYFIPFWPLLAVMTVLVPASLQATTPSRTAEHGLKAFFLLALALSLSAFLRLAAYGRLAAQGSLSLDSSLDLALAASPQDAWLLTERGRRKLQRGELDSAVSEFSKALSLDPSYERHLDLSRALAAKGLPHPLLMNHSFSDSSAYPHQSALSHISRALVWLGRGDENRARRELELGQAALAPRPAEGRVGTSAEEKRVFSLMESSSRRNLDELVEEALQPLAPTRRRVLLQKLLRLEPENGSLILQLAETAAQGKDKTAVLDLLARAERCSLDLNEELRLIGLYRRLQAPQRASSRLDRLAARFPNNARLQLMRAELAIRNNRPSEALLLLTGAQALRAESDARRWLARLYNELGRHDLALTVLESLSRASPGEPETWVVLAETTWRLSLFERALKALERTQELRIDAPVLQRQIAGLYYEMGRPEQAYRLLELWGNEQSQEAETWLLKAQAAWRTQRSEAASAALKRALALGAEARLPRQVAELYCEMGRPEQALALMASLKKEDSPDPEAWLLLARAAWRAGRGETALSALKQARSFELEPPQQLHAAMLYRELGRNAQARILLKTLLARTPADPAAWLEQARLELASAEKAAALFSLSKAAGLNPSAEQRRAFALAYQELKEYRRALALWDALLSEGPARASDLSDRGLCHYLNGAAAAAMADLEAAVRLDPGFLPAYLTLGSIYQRQGLARQASKLYRDALAASPRPAMEPLRRQIEQELLRLR